MLKFISELYPADCDKGLFHFRGGIMLHMPQCQVTVLEKGNETLDTPNMWWITKEHEEIFSQTLNHRNSLTILDTLYHLPPNETPVPDNCYSPSVTARSTPPATHGTSRRVSADFIGVFLSLLWKAAWTQQTAWSHCSLRSGPCLHPGCTGSWGRAAAWVAGEWLCRCNPLPDKDGCGFQKASISCTCQL